MAPVFFIHVMRTGGSTFKTVLQERFGPSHVYPDTATDLDLASVAETTQNPFGHPIRSQAALDSYISIDRLLAVPPERRAELQAYVGHFPFVVTELMDIDLVTVTLLRDPVERTISQLRTAKARRVRFADASLEEIYEDGFEFPFFIHDHQSKVFAMQADDRLESILDVVDIDERRLALARANLEKVDVLGLQERYGEFLAAIEHRLGWRPPPRPDLNVSGGEPQISPSFRKRICDDNAADIELYRHACGLISQR